MVTYVRELLHYINCIIIGMSNETLAEVQHFNCEVHNLVTNFINRQAMPTCFVAYNGNNFDFPILLSEYKSINKVFIFLCQNNDLQFIIFPAYK